MKVMNLLMPVCLVLFLFFNACSGNGHTLTENSKADSGPDTTNIPGNNTLLQATLPTDIEGIQKTFAEISKQLEEGVLDSTSFTYNCQNEKSGNVSYFSLNEDLRMIVHRFNEYDHHAASEYYYVMDSSLFFVYNHTLTWSFESGPQGSTKDNITEHRVYFIDHKPIRCLEKKYVIRSQLSDNPDPDSIPNQEIDCSAITVMDGFQNLLKYRYKAPTGCL